MGMCVYVVCLYKVSLIGLFLAVSLNDTNIFFLGGGGGVMEEVVAKAVKRKAASF